jgi:small membrane protein
MSFSQIILLALVLILTLYVFRFRTVLRDRIIYLFLIVIGLIFIISPDLSTHIANLINIGRGTDLILYAFIMFTLFYIVGVSSQLKKTDAQITALVRQLAITNAIQGGTPSLNPIEDNPQQS